MNLFVYVLRSDSGFAPNPFGGLCTLATCKPAVRRTARRGDWVAGLGAARRVGAGRLVYAMRIAEVLPLSQYCADSRFAIKQPSVEAPWWRRLGDNIYFIDEPGQWRQRRGRHGPKQMPRDLSGRNALVGDEFYYFGRDAPELPDRLRHIIKQGPGHRRVRDSTTVEAFVSWLRQTFATGVTGEPWERRIREGA